MIKKDKVYELKIEEDDDVSGIDSISLVDEPAIEINWMYFSKEKAHEFHIPDNEDNKYVEKLQSIAQNEQELFDEGYVISKITPMGKVGFITAPDPNGPSEEDEKQYRVRYKYILNPKAEAPSIIPTTRDFCKELVQKNYVWRLEDLDALTNDEGDSALVWRGGYNCRHLWARIEYTLDSTIRNKASVNTGKVMDGNFPTDITPDTRILGMEQPSTVVRAHPSFSKQVYNSIDIYGYKTRFFHICPGAQETFKHLISMDNDEDTIGMIRSAAQVADNVFRIEDEVIKSGEATSSQLQEAIVLVDDFKDIILEIDKISGMKHDVSYMDGHIDKIKEYVKEDMGYDVSTIGGYQDPGIKKKKKKDQKFAIDSEEKRTIVGPCMVPDLRIPRKDFQGNFYSVYFSAETIKMIAEKYMKNQYTRNNDLMHDGTAVEDIYVIESWIKEDESDKSVKYGYGDLPIGTWFVAMKCAKTPQGDKVWEMVKSGELAGYSVSGWFEEVAAFCREEMFLQKVVEVLKKYD